MALTQKDISRVVEEIVQNTPITDVHTHLFAPEFGTLMLAGIDELLTYHYLISEALRIDPVPYEVFWAWSKREQANFIWKTLFVDNTPYSEACRGVVTVLQSLGVDLSTRNLDDYRATEAQFTSTSEYVDFVFRTAGVERVVMTNDPFDPSERSVWLSSSSFDERFHAALRIDPLLNDFSNTVPKLREWGYNVSEELSDQDISEIQRFLREWVQRMSALYVAVSLPNDFVLKDDIRSRLIREAVLPVCREFNIPFALMIGVKRAVNSELQSAGDGLGKADIAVVEELCSTYSKNKFLITMLSRENQHELAVAARKFRNLMVFGCWWFLNNPSLIDEITRMRFELLGSSVIPQHSDARILDQLIYKWAHSKHIIAAVLTEKYTDLIRAGWTLETADIERDIRKLFSSNFWEFVNWRLN